MGGIITPTKEEEIMKLLRLDDPKNLQKFIKDNQLTPDLVYTKHKRTLLQLSCYYESPKCLAKLIELNYNYNQIESSTGNTPLYISCKFNCLNLVTILLSKDDCKKLVKNNENLNEFDIAFLKGNYAICYYLLYEYKNDKNGNNEVNNELNINNIENEENENINTNVNIDINKNNPNGIDYDINQIYQNYFFNTNFDLDNFLMLQESNKYPLFNMSLFFKSLCKKIPPNKCESFAPEKKKTKDLMTKIPNPNESWGHFFKRMVNMDLYNPPLVDKKNVTQMNSLYMNTQMKLLENEYGVKLSYYNQNEHNVENNNILDDDEDAPIIKIKKKSNKTNSNNKKNNIKNKEEDEEDINDENNKIGKKNEDLCVIKVKESSERNIKDNIKNNNDE